MNNITLQKILDEHKLWLNSEGGRRADLSGADLSDANLSGVNLSGVNLNGANLSSADLRGVNFSGANLNGADLSGVNLSGANLYRADLSGADLRGADLSGSNLSGAYLYNCIGCGVYIKSLNNFDSYDITYTSRVLQIGCKQFTINEWWDFSDEEILKMDGKKALDFWNKNKEMIRKLIETYPAKD